MFKSSSKELSAREASRSLYLGVEVLEPALEEFVAAGILTKIIQDTAVDKYLYTPNCDQLAEAIDQTAGAYAGSRVAMINLIFASSAQSFADAFKIRQEDEP